MDGGSTIPEGVWPRFSFGGILLVGIVVAHRRELPVGWDGHPPSFTLRGRAAVAAGIALALFGLAGVIHGNFFP